MNVDKNSLVLWKHLDWFRSCRVTWWRNYWKKAKIKLAHSRFGERWPDIPHEHLSIAFRWGIHEEAHSLFKMCSLDLWPQGSFQTDGSHTRDDVTLARSTRAQQAGSIFAKRKDARKHSHLRSPVTAIVQRSLYNSSSYQQPHLRTGSNKQRRWGRGVNYHWTWNIN